MAKSRARGEKRITNEQWLTHIPPEEREQRIRENVVVPCDLAPDDFCTMDCDTCMEEYTKKWLKAEH
jgi:hypothetical protein